MKFVFLIYCLNFFVMSAIYFFAMGKASARLFGDAVFMMAVFSLSKGAALALEYFKHVGPVVERLSDMFGVITNVFLFQAALSFLMFRLPTRYRFRVVPVILFSSYIVLYVFNIITPEDIEKIASMGFGYNSAILMSIAMFNLFFILKRRRLFFAGVGFVFYCIFEGTLLISVFDKNIVVAKALASFILMVSSVFVTTVTGEKKPEDKISYV